MAKEDGNRGVGLVIVESPAKARTISRFLGERMRVEASIGHIRDLPTGAKDMPEALKSEEWARLGVNVNEGFQPFYVIPPEKKKQVAKLRQLLKDADELYLATDEDREGEAISWHLCEVLKPKAPVKRLVFHEITQEAIENALKEPRDIDTGLVRAQETRRILDRLFGYEVSMLLWKKVRTGLSAGRVQSVAVRLIVEREWERMAFVSSSYWDLIASLRPQSVAAETSGTPANGKSSGAFEAELSRLDGKKIPVGADFDSATGKPKDPDALAILTEASAKDLIERIQAGPWKVTKIEEKPFTDRPKPPFTTSTLQQEANRKLNFTARRTMQVAQSLYENGHITYMRTDSTSLAQVAVDAARDLVRSEYGGVYLPASPRAYVSKVKNAQEAHEAIRPAGHPFELPQLLKNTLTPDEFKLFELIWKRTIACQMENARGRRTTVTIESDGAEFTVSGKTIDFPGYLRAYVEGSDDPDAELGDQESILPPLSEGQVLDLLKLDAKYHQTQPPWRYSEAALTQELERRGIGRPSTYASIIDTIQARDYVFRKGSALTPTWVAFAVTALLKSHFERLVDYDFTAQMEDDLDSISRGEKEPADYLQRFYFGNGAPGLKPQLASKETEIDPREISRFVLGKAPMKGESGGVEGEAEVAVRVGRYGPFIEHGDRRASLLDQTAPDEVTLKMALELLDKADVGDEPLGHDPESGRPVFRKQGRFGPYVQLGPLEEGDKPKNASLLKGMLVEDVNLETALRLLSLPRELGVDPKSGETVVATNGRYGPYVQCGKETRSLPDALSPLEVTLEQALGLLAQPKTRGRRGAAAPKEPIKTFDKSPVTEQPVTLLDGRYGPYVTDGESNASIPKDTTAENVTFEMALDLLAARRAAKPPKKKAVKKKAAKKAAKTKATKKAVKKKATKKKR